MAQQEYILQLQNVVKRFGGITASNDITINVPRGSIYGIIGPNGAGKTTLFNMITGVYDTTEGRVLFEGQQVNGLPTHVIAARGIARTFQNIRLFGVLRPPAGGGGSVGSEGPAGQQPALRHAAAAGDRQGPGDPAQADSAGRARGRDERGGE